MRFFTINKKSSNMVVFNQLVLKLVMRKYQILYYCWILFRGVFALDFAIRNPYFIERLILIETMIYLPKWLWLTLLPGYCSGYRIFQKRIKTRFKILKCCTKFKNISSSERIKCRRKNGIVLFNSFLFKNMNSMKNKSY